MKSASKVGREEVHVQYSPTEKKDLYSGDTPGRYAINCHSNINPSMVQKLHTAPDANIVLNFCGLGLDPSM